MKENKTREYICFGACAVISIAFIFIINYKVGYYMDDLWYSTNLVTGEPLKNFMDVIQSQVWHYNNWGGRSMSHGLLQISFLCGPYAINYINTVCTILLAVLLCKVSGKVMSRDGFLMSILAFALFVSCNASLQETLFWQSGVANYLYMGLAQMLYLWLFLRMLKDDAKDNVWLGIVAMLVAPIAGWSNENMGPAVFLGSLAAIIIYMKTSKKIKWWMLPASLECLAGSVFMILAPGNFIRSKEAENALYDARLHRQIIYRIYFVTKGMFEYLFPILIVVVLLLVVYCGILKLQLNQQEWILLMVGILATGAMLLSPHFPDRASFGIMIVFIALALKLLRGMMEARADVRRYVKLITGFFWIAAMYGCSVRLLYEIGVLRF